MSRVYNAFSTLTFVLMCCIGALSIQSSVHALPLGEDADITQAFEVYGVFYTEFEGETHENFLIKTSNRQALIFTDPNTGIEHTLPVDIWGDPSVGGSTVYFTTGDGQIKGQVDMSDTITQTYLDGQLVTLTIILRGCIYITSPSENKLVVEDGYLTNVNQ